MEGWRGGGGCVKVEGVEWGRDRAGREGGEGGGGATGKGGEVEG